MRSRQGQNCIKAESGSAQNKMKGQNARTITFGRFSGTGGNGRSTCQVCHQGSGTLPVLRSIGRRIMERNDQRRESIVCAEKIRSAPERRSTPHLPKIVSSAFTSLGQIDGDALGKHFDGIAHLAEGIVVRADLHQDHMLAHLLIIISFPHHRLLHYTRLDLFDIVI